MGSTLTAEEWWGGMTGLVTVARTTRVLAHLECRSRRPKTTVE